MLVLIILVASFYIRFSHSDIFTENSLFMKTTCISTTILIDDTKEYEIIPSNLNLLFKVSQRTFIFKTNSTTNLPFLLRRSSENCFIFNIFLNSISDSSESVVQLVRLIQNSSFAFNEENVHFLIHLENNSVKKSTFLNLMENGVTKIKIKESGDEEEDNKDFLMSARITFFIGPEVKSYCYSCSPGHKLEMSVNLREFYILSESIGLFQALSENHKYSSKNHQLIGYVFSSTGGEVDNLKNENCTRESIESRPGNCFTSHIVLNIATSRLNMTLEETDKFDEDPPEHIALYLCLVCDPKVYFEEIKYPPPIVHYDNLQIFNFIYCQLKGNFEPPKWSMMSRPFDKYIWLLILVSCLLISAVKRDLWFGADIFFVILSQPVQKRWPPEMTFIFLSLIVLTYGYLGVVTVDLTEPPQEKRISTIESLIYGKEFKFAASEEIIMQGYLTLYFNPTFSKIKVSPDMYQIVESINFTNFLVKPIKTITKLAMVKGSMSIPGMTSIQPFMRRGYRMKLGNASCSTIEESMVANLHWIIRLSEAIKMYKVLQVIQMAGLEDFWEKVQKRAQLGKMLYRLHTAEARDDVFSLEPKALNMDASPKIIFYLYCILIAVCCKAFIAEFILKKACLWISLVCVDVASFSRRAFGKLIIMLK